jgi:hypothetical protein
LAPFDNNISTARSGLGDSGITGGIHIPLASEMIKQCRENAKAFVKRNNLKMINNLIAHCTAMQKSGVDVADNDFKTSFPDFKNCKSVKLVAKAGGRNPSPEGGPESGILSEPERGQFNLKAIIPRDGFTFGPPRTPLLETFPIRNR